METVIVYETDDAVARAVAAAFQAAARDAVAARGTAHVALSGGSTPRRTYALLADAAEPFRARIPWDRLHVWWSDERTVAPDQPESNYRMARETLLAHVPVPERHIHRMAGELGPADAARLHEEDLVRAFRLASGGVPAFDLMLLGLGEDGHTASLFPGTRALDERGHLVVANRVDQHHTTRLTLTVPVLLAARDVVVMATGASKAAALAAVFAPGADPHVSPAAVLRCSAHRVRWMVDRDAAFIRPQPPASA